MFKRPLRFLWIALLPLLVGTAHADLVGDAKSLVNSLQGMGDYGLATASSAINGARSTCQSSLNSTTEGVNRLTALRAENQRLAAALPSGATPINLPTESSLEAARVGLDAAGSVWSTAVQSTSIASTAARSLAGSGGDAISALRGLIFKPFGTRSLTYRGKCRVPYTNIEEDCDLPNGPPSDDELRNAIRQGNNVASGVASIGATAVNSYYTLVMSSQKDWMQRYLTYSDLLCKQRKSIEQARLTKLHAPATAVPPTLNREPIHVRK